MRTGNDGAALRGLATLWGLGATRDLTDGQLLERFATGTGEAAELAFEALVERHKAMVLRVCRAHLADPHDAHDAFQATFLVLVRKARGLWVRDSLGPWLHQVARRSALRARSTAARRRAIEHKAAGRTPEALADSPRPDLDLEEALHEEIDRLPDRHRVSIVLCDLQGLSCEEAARRMGRPVGTVKSWRARGRERLRSRLLRRGLAPSVGLVATIAANAAPTIRLVPDSMTAGEVSASVQELARGVLKAMFMSKLKSAAAAALAVACLAGGLGAVAWGLARVPKTPPVKPWIALPDDGAKESGVAWPLSLQEAIRLGLANADFVRVVSAEKGAPLGIAAAASIDNREFEARVTNLVRALEESYWTLNQQLAMVREAEKSADLAQEVVSREKGKIAPIEDRPFALMLREDARFVRRAQGELSGFNHDARAGRSAASETEERLRKFFGMPPNDERRIVPVTAPTETLFETGWKQSHARKNLSESDRATIELKEEAASAAYMALQNASRDRRFAGEDLAAAREKYDAGNDPALLYLDAISKFTAATTRESERKKDYNLAITDFERYKGTLLERNEITIADESAPPPTLSLAESKQDGETGVAVGKTYSFLLSIGPDPKPIEIRGSLTIAPAR